MFLVDVDMYPDPGPLASENSDQMIRFNLFRFLSGKKCSSICPEKTTENSIQMVSAPSFQNPLQFCQTCTPREQNVLTCTRFEVAANKNHKFFRDGLGIRESKKHKTIFYSQEYVNTSFRVKITNDPPLGSPGPPPTPNKKRNRRRMFTDWGQLNVCVPKQQSLHQNILRPLFYIVDSFLS